MKKLALLAVAMFVAGTGAAVADQIATPIGTGYVNEGGYIIMADGVAGNPDPLDGYIGLGNDGQCHGAMDGGSSGDAATDPVCSAPA